MVCNRGLGDPGRERTLWGGCHYVSSHACCFYPNLASVFRSRKGSGKDGNSGCNHATRRSHHDGLHYAYLGWYSRTRKYRESIGYLEGQSSSAIFTGNTDKTMLS